MKRILLRDRGPFKAKDVIIGMLESPGPSGGISYADMRKRDRVLDAIDKNKGTFLDLEDEDYNVLMGVLNQAQFITAKRELRQILDDISQAKAPEETLRVVEDTAEGA